MMIFLPAPDSFCPYKDSQFGFVGVGSGWESVWTWVRMAGIRLDVLQVKWRKALSWLTAETYSSGVNWEVNEFVQGERKLIEGGRR